MVHCDNLYDEWVHPLLTHQHLMVVVWTNGFAVQVPADVWCREASDLRRGARFFIPPLSILYLITSLSHLYIECGIYLRPWPCSNTDTSVLIKLEQLRSCACVCVCVCNSPWSQSYRSVPPPQWGPRESVGNEDHNISPGWLTPHFPSHLSLSAASPCRGRERLFIHNRTSPHLQ